MTNTGIKILKISDEYGKITYTAEGFKEFPMPNSNQLTRNADVLYEKDGRIVEESLTAFIEKYYPKTDVVNLSNKKANIESKSVNLIQKIINNIKKIKNIKILR